MLNLEPLEDRRLLATFSVTSSSDGPVTTAGELPGSLRQAIFDANANPGADTITFGASVFTGGSASLINLTAGELEITEALLIDGSTGSELTIDAQGDSRVLNFSAIAGDLTLDGLTITGGRTTGDSAFFSDSTYSGGGIRFGSNGTLSLVSSSVNDNRTVGDSANGGGIFTSAGIVNLTGSTISNNRTTGDGSKGGGIATSTGEVNLFRSTLSGNRTAGDLAAGGGLFTRHGSVTLTSSTASDNRTVGLLAGGGGIYTSSGAVTATSSTVSNNRTVGESADGGGIFTHSGAISLDSSTLSGNSTAGDSANGGGIFVGNYGGSPLPGGAVTLINSTLSGNRTTGANADGGGLLTRGSMVSIESSTVTDNVAARAGGGLKMDNSFSNLLLTIQNSIVAGNADNGTAPDFTAPRNPTTNLVVSHSFIGDNTGTTLAAAAVGSPDANGNLIGTTATPIDPLLEPLAFNGGSTQTHALLPGSPAINAGDPAFTSPTVVEQRGTPFLRVADHRLDMGAYERQAIAASFFVVTTTTDELDYSNADVSLREAVSSANGSVGADEITFDPAVFTGGNASLIRLTAGELEIIDALTIDGSSASGVTITGDANGNDQTNAATITDVAVSSTNSLADNSRVLNFSAVAGDLTLKRLTLTGGRTTEFSEHGGGIRFLSEGTLALVSSTLSGNSTAGGVAHGGGIYAADGAVTLINSTVSGNRTAGFASDGGGIHASFGAVTLISSTVSSNRTAGFTSDGGGICMFNGALTLTNSTVSGNSATGSGGGIYVPDANDSNDSPALTINNSIVAGNTDNGTAPDIHLNLDSTLTIHHSLIGVTEGLVGGNNQTGTSASPLDPLLGPLAYNGGPTQTHALLTGSPAIDAGSNALAVDQDGQPLTRDQRGFTRVIDGENNGVATVDIGAVEQNVASPVVASRVRDQGGVLARPDLVSSFAISFDVDVSVTAFDLVIRNETLGGAAVDSSGLVFGYDATTHTATWDVASLSLEPAFYSFVLTNNIVSAVGNLSLDGNVDGNSGGTFVETVYVALPGDANLNGTVDVLGDAALLVNNLGTTAGAVWADGDFNGDGAVDVLVDAALLINRLGQSVVPPMAALASSQTLAGVVVAIEPASFSTGQEDDLQPTRWSPSSLQLALAGSQDIDAAFASFDV